MQRAGIVDRDRSGLAGHVFDPVHVDRGRILVRQHSGPVAVGIILVEQRFVVGSAQGGERAVLHVRIRQITPDRQYVVVGMRKELDILVPLHAVRFVEPFEIQLGVMEHHVRTDKVRRHIGHQPGGKIPVDVTCRVGTLQPAQHRMIRTVAGTDVKPVVARGNGFALFDKIFGRRLQHGQNVGGYDLRHADKALFEIILALFLTQNTGGFGQNLFRRHGSSPSRSADWRLVSFSHGNPGVRPKARPASPLPADAFHSCDRRPEMFPRGHRRQSPQRPVSPLRRYCRNAWRISA